MLDAFAMHCLDSMCKVACFGGEGNAYVWVGGFFGVVTARSQNHEVSVVQ